MTAEPYGPAVIVDDSVDAPSGALKDIVDQLEEAGLPLVKFTSLPDVRAFRHWQQLGLIVLDWELSFSRGDGEEALPQGMSVPAELAENNASEVCEFIRALLDSVYAPIFVISNQDPDRIQIELDERLADIRGKVEKRVVVRQKAEASVDVLGLVRTSLAARPALFALKEWTSAFVAATRTTFLDLESASGDWVAAIAAAAKIDHMEPALEIGDVISRNILNRMAPFVFEVPVEPMEPLDGESLRRVLHLRAVVPAAGLDEQRIGSGDIFVKRDAAQPYENVFILVTPDCDLVGRSDADFLRGTVLNASRRPAFKKASKNRVEGLRKSTEGHVLSSMLTPLGEEYDIDLGSWTVRAMAMKGDDLWAGHLRIGRLMDPYLTHLQQRFALYVSRKGLPALPNDYFD